MTEERLLARRRQRSSTSWPKIARSSCATTDGFGLGRGIRRTISPCETDADNTYTIVDTTTGTNQVIGSTDEISAFTQLHTEAVYLHQGEP